MVQNWSPLLPAEVSSLFENVTAPWGFAGGYAIEMFLGDAFRLHEDIDVVIYREDQRVFRNVLEGWHVMACDPPGQHRPWDVGEVLSEHVHDIWCAKHADEDWCLQIMLMDHDEEDWIYRRHRGISLPKDNIFMMGKQGDMYLKPEIQLLFKSKAPRQKDEIDFLKTVPKLSSEARDWLAFALRECDPENPWLSSVAQSQNQ